jgi:hypothetical protein
MVRARRHLGGQQDNYLNLVQARGLHNMPVSGSRSVEPGILLLTVKFPGNCSELLDSRVR